MLLGGDEEMAWIREEMGWSKQEKSNFSTSRHMEGKEWMRAMEREEVQVHPLPTNHELTQEGIGVKLNHVSP